MGIHLPEAPGGSGGRTRHHGAAAAPTPTTAEPARDRTTSATFRFLTANIQSYPEDAITSEQALVDLSRNANDGDLVLLQEIAFRYHPLVRDAFPAPEWEVYYGKSDNAQPIAFRTDLFTRTAGDVTLLHPPRPHLHRRRYITHVRLRHRSLGCELHVSNLHLVAGAFNDVIEPDQALRAEEWNEGIVKHLAMLERLAASGLPLLGGGDYNRQLRQHPSVGTRIGGRPVTYAVDAATVDLLWVVDGERAHWDVDARTVYPARGRKNSARNSDHAAREATLTLSVRPKEASMPTHTRSSSGKNRQGSNGSPRGRGRSRRPASTAHPGPFELTTFGDGTPKKVDWKTRAALEEAQRRLGYPLTVVQGCYNAGGVSASAGTHDGGGVVDLLAWDWKRKVHVLRAIGFAAWYRPTVPGLWGQHIHAVLIDHGRLSPSAARQVAAYRLGRDGLAGNAVDHFWRPDPIPVFHYPPKSAPARDRDPGGGATDGTPERPTSPVPGRGPAYPPRRTLDGVDTSHHQSGRIDLKSARAAGVRWWYLKATEGDSFVDPSYRARVRQARGTGIPVGAYHFARPDTHDAVAEARHFLKNSDIRAGDMLPMLDLETTEGLKQPELTRWVGTWVRTVTAELAARNVVGKPIIYTPFNLDNGFGCLLWVARYSDDYRAPVIPKPWERAVIWQHSDGRFGPIKNVPGFGAVDVNALHPDVPLSALRLRPAGQQPRPTGRRRGRPSAPTGGDDLADARRSLRAAAAAVEAALDALPER